MLSIEKCSPANSCLVTLSLESRERTTVFVNGLFGDLTDNLFWFDSLPIALDIT